MIEFEQVTKVFGDACVVEDFSLQIPAHSFQVFLGSSGAGKTTLLRMINATLSPTSGRILINSEDVSHQPAVQLRRSIGYVMQDGGLLPHRTVLDNVTTVLRLNKVPKKEAQHTGLAMMEKLGLDPQLASRYPHELSGGQAQRVGVARALAPKPNIVLMDEPFGALDPVVRAELQDLMRGLHKDLGTTIVFVTHDVREATSLADHIVLLETGGHVAQAGTPQALLDTPASDFVSRFMSAAQGNEQS
ncbi:MAG: ABC transporter ATP-binding protein [Actinomycetaceae bacterium]|nr:ABC transporter ATP-binding protein [Actinomycetaceae bacterium]